MSIRHLLDRRAARSTRSLSGTYSAACSSSSTA